MLVDEKWVFISCIPTLLTMKKNTQYSYCKAGTSPQAGKKYFCNLYTSFDKAYPREKYIY